MNVTIPENFSFDVNHLDCARELFTDEWMDDFYDELVFDLVGIFMKEFQLECKSNFVSTFKGEDLSHEQTIELEEFIKTKVKECLTRQVIYSKDLRDYTLKGMDSRILMWVAMNTEITDKK